MNKQQLLNLIASLEKRAEKLHNEIRNSGIMTVNNEHLHAEYASVMSMIKGYKGAIA